VDPKKVAMDAIRPWVANRITEILGFEDEVLIGYAFGLLDDKESLNPRELQLNMDVFLEAEAPHFVSDLWRLLLSAQASPGGIPAEFLEQKKAELRQKKEEDMRVKNNISAAISRDRERVVQELEQRRSQVNQPTDTPSNQSTASSGKALPYGLYLPSNSHAGAAGQAISQPGHNGKDGNETRSRRWGREDERRRDNSRERDREKGHYRRDRDRERRRRSRSRERRHSRDEEAGRDRDRRRDRDRDRDRHHRRHRDDSRQEKSENEKKRQNEGAESKRKREDSTEDDTAKAPTPKRTSRTDSEDRSESALREQAMHSLLLQHKGHNSEGDGNTRA